MKRRFLEELGLGAEIVEKIMAEHGKSTQGLQKELDELLIERDLAVIERDKFRMQLEDVQICLKVFDGVDVDELNCRVKTLSDELENAQKAATAEVAKLKMQAETKDFLSGLGKKFVTPEMQEYFASKLNAALENTACAGKNRADIYSELIKGADGTERTDIYAQESINPNTIVLPPAEPVIGKEKQESPPRAI